MRITFLIFFSCLILSVYGQSRRYHGVTHFVKSLEGPSFTFLAGVTYLYPDTHKIIGCNSNNGIRVMKMLGELQILAGVLHTEQKNYFRSRLGWNVRYGKKAKIFNWGGGFEYTSNSSKKRRIDPYIFGGLGYKRVFISYEYSFNKYYDKNLLGLMILI